MKNPIGQFLRALRINKGLNQSKFAELCGVSQTTIGTWERGDNTPTPENFAALAKALDMDPAALRQMAEGTKEIVEAERRVLPLTNFGNRHVEHQDSLPERIPVIEFERQIIEFLKKAGVRGTFEAALSSPGGRRWRVDYMSDRVVAEFVCLTSWAAVRAALTGPIYRTMVRLLAAKAFSNDNDRTYMIVLCAPNGLLGEGDMSSEAAARNNAMLMTASMGEAAVLGLQMCVVATPRDAAEAVITIEEEAETYDIEHEFSEN